MRPALAALAFAAAASACGNADERIAALHARCADDMLRRTCRVMSTASVAQAPPGSVVFVAGFGPVDAATYNDLRAAGDAMCSQLASRCRTDWDGPACRTGRALYAAAR